MTFLHRPTLILLGVSVLLMLALSGCNTAHGFGQDVQHAGQSIERASK